MASLKICHEILMQGTERTSKREIISSGIVGGLVGGVGIWIYEAAVWVGAQHLMPLAGILRNATGLVFGQHIQESIGIWAYLIGTGIHFAFAVLWGILFASVWPYLRKRGYEATFLALVFAVLSWVVMHLAIVMTSDFHPKYSDPVVIIGGIMSHLFFAVPLALVVKRRLSYGTSP